jgi:hypothetical protein
MECVRAAKRTVAARKQEWLDNNRERFDNKKTTRAADSELLRGMNREF